MFSDNIKKCVSITFMVKKKTLNFTSISINKIDLKVKQWFVLFNNNNNNNREYIILIWKLRISVK